MVLVLFAYLLLQLGKMSPTTICYSFLNTLGSVFILVSLFYHLNIASAVIEVAWLIISLYGLIKALYIRRNAPTTLSE